VKSTVMPRRRVLPRISLIAGVSGFVFVAFLVLAIAAPAIAPQNPYDLSSLNLADARLPPGSQGGLGDFYLLGTDAQGRDLLSAILYGLRISLTVALVTACISMLIGTALGLFAGYYGRALDAIIMRVVDLQLAIPSILIALILLAVLGRGPEKIVFALVAVQWVYFARTIRGSTLVEREKDYVLAFRVQGFSGFRIVFFHILPNVLPAVSAVATVSVAGAVALESTLSFLGVAMPITEPSLGLLVANGMSRILNGEYWISVFPGLALLIVVLALNVLTDELQDALNPLRR
jgi:peptide/nickel transport system permease protein